MRNLLFILILIFTASCAPMPSVEWTEGATDADGRALHTLVLHEMPAGSRVWFQELFDGKTVVEGPAIQHYQGTSWYIDIEKGGTVTLRYYGRPLPRRTWAPEAFVLQQKGRPDRPLETVYHYLPLPDDAQETPELLYSEGIADLIPQVKQAQYEVDSTQVGENHQHPAGWYRIMMDANGLATIEADDEDGAYYAQTTLQQLSTSKAPLTIEDWPDLPYRGFMLDVVRDFRSVDEVLHILDLIASWKLNTLHFHLADDESWCLEIKPLPDLTEYGAHHSLPDWNLQETEALKPTANGRIGQTTYYTAEEYQRILRYAWERRIAVIPEFDTPGHSRASIKAMQAYERRTGDSSLRLQDPADTSHYWSAQDFTDNVLSVYLPSVYRFYGIVFDEVIRLYEEAGVPLRAIHIGGDEVPQGAWAGRDRHEMKELFTNGMLDLAEQRGLKLAGWEDIARGLEPATEQRLKRSLYYLNVWNTEGIEGFPVVLSPASHTYLDLAYNDSHDEIGLSWAGYVDERATFEWKPTDYLGDLIGVEAQLWSSQLRSFDDVTYQMLPKALGVVERAWNAYPEWSTPQAADSAYLHFLGIIDTKEKPLWDAQGLFYRKKVSGLSR